LRTVGLPSTAWRNVWAHGDGPMRSVALVNYDGNASTNTIRSISSEFSLALRCCDNDATLGAATTGGPPPAFGCNNITNASITTTTIKGNGTTTLLALTNTPLTSAGSCRLLQTVIPANIIRTTLGVVTFHVAGEYELRAAAAVTRKALERLRIALRTKTLTAAFVQQQRVGTLTPAEAVLRSVQQGPLTTAALATGVVELRTWETKLHAAVANIALTASGRASVGRAATVAAAESAVLALAAVPPANSKWQLLPARLLWNASIGFGWVAAANTSFPHPTATVVTSPDAASTDPLHANFLGWRPSTTDMALPSPVSRAGLALDNPTLRIEIPPGVSSGVVTLITGSYDASRQSATTALEVRGAVTGGTLRLPGDLGYSGYYRHPSFRFDCGGGNRSLFITLFSETSVSGSFYGDGYSQGTHSYTAVLNGVLVSSGEEAPTMDGEAYLALAGSLAVTQLRHWMFVGPFEDPHFTARERTVGPELSSGNLNYSQSFHADGSGRRLQWQSLEVVANSSMAAPVAMRMPQGVAVAAFNRTVAAVLCTHLFVPPATLDGAPQQEQQEQHSTTTGAGATTLEVEMSGSVSGLSEIYLNGQAVAQDRLITGQLLSEISHRSLTLVRGQWNPLCAKVSHLSWEAEWSIALSVHQPGVGPILLPVRGLQTKP
jgi:hypothetical protein